MMMMYAENDDGMMMMMYAENDDGMSMMMMMISVMSLSTPDHHIIHKTSVIISSISYSVTALLNIKHNFI